MIRKTLLVLVLILFLGLGLFFAQKNSYYSLCDSPITFSIDRIDRQFNFPRKEFLVQAKKAADIWNKKYGRDIFVATDTGVISVNLVYDERQKLINEIGSLEKDVKTNQNSVEAQVAKFNEEVANYKSDLAKFNQDVEKFNKEQGPKEEYDRLISVQKDLQNRAQELNANGQRLNQLTAGLNLKIANLNGVVDDFNNTLVVKPEEGLYDPKRNRIEIYFNVNSSELTHTLSHEFGHVLGIGHNQNPKSIMYPSTSKTLVLSNEDSKDLDFVCRRRNRIEEIFASFKQAWYNLFS